LLSTGAVLVFICFFLASPLCTPSTFCCFVVVLIPLVETVDLLFSSVAAAFLPVGALFDVIGFLAGVTRATFSSSLSSDCELGDDDDTTVLTGGGGVAVGFFFVLLLILF